LLPATPKLLPAPHQSYNISQLPLSEMEKVKLLQLHFLVTAAVADVGGGREGCLAAFRGKWVYVWVL